MLCIDRMRPRILGAAFVAATIARTAAARPVYDETFVATSSANPTKLPPRPRLYIHIGDDSGRVLPRIWTNGELRDLTFTALEHGDDLAYTDLDVEAGSVEAKVSGIYERQTFVISKDYIPRTRAVTYVPDHDQVVIDSDAAVFRDEHDDVVWHRRNTGYVWLDDPDAVTRIFLVDRRTRPQERTT